MKLKNKKLLYLCYELGYISKLEMLKTINISKYGKLTCELCKGYLSKPSIDHILPKSKKGNNNINNLRLTHSKCNSIRSSRFTWKDKLQILFL